MIETSFSARPRTGASGARSQAGAGSAGAACCLETEAESTEGIETDGDMAERSIVQD